MTTPNPAPLLIDTQVLVWALTDPDRIKDQARQHIANASTTVFVSAASTWEIAIKVSIGRMPPPHQDLLDGIRRLGFDLLSIQAGTRSASAVCRSTTETRSTACSWRKRSARGSSSSRETVR